MKAVKRIGIILIILGIICLVGLLLSRMLLFGTNDASFDFYHKWNIRMKVFLILTPILLISGVILRLVAKFKG